jgi:hypothetical protein
MNRPFSGSIVPAKHLAKTTAVRSMMLEVRRDLYMSEATGTPLLEFRWCRGQNLPTVVASAVSADWVVC